MKHFFRFKLQNTDHWKLWKVSAYWSPKNFSFKLFLIKKKLENLKLLEENRPFELKESKHCVMAKFGVISSTNSIFISFVLHRQTSVDIPLRQRNSGFMPLISNSDWILMIKLSLVQLSKILNSKIRLSLLSSKWWSFQVQ